MVIQNVQIVKEEGIEKVDIEINDGVIVKIANNIVSDAPIDAKGAYAFPSIVDANVRLKDATLSSKNLDQLSLECYQGGIHLALLSPESTPAIDSEIELEFVNKHKESTSYTKIEPLINAIKEDDTLSNIAILLKKGSIAPFVNSSTDSNLITRIAQYVKMYDATLFVRAQDSDLTKCGVMNDSVVASKLGLGGIPMLGEHLHVSKMIEISKHFGIKIIFQSIASPYSVDLITKAKAQGVQVSCEVSALHLTFSEEHCIGFNTSAKIDPPLVSKEDVVALQACLKRGEIDYLTALHHPNSPVNKEVAFFDAAYGSASIKDILAFYYTKFVKTGLISMQALIRLTSEQIIEDLHLRSNSIEEGHVANFVLLDTNSSYTVSNPLSLLHGEELDAKIVYHIKEGLLSDTI